MKVEKTSIPGLLVIHPQVFQDERGFFFESYNERVFKEAGIDRAWRQDNHARSRRNIIRALHYQRGLGQAKLVRCTLGAVWDVAVDIRPDSPTFGRWHAVELTEENKSMLYIPPGLAHGYAVLSDVADVLYKVDRHYDREIEAGIAWDDPEIGIEWPVSDPILSARDRSNPSFASYRKENT
jgi:dTDP-4-dehydrorhamnose 3,5-epimerase